MHHSDKSLSSENMQKLFGDLPVQRFGATRRFPEGQIDPSDQGELQLGIACDVERGKVIMNFGTPVEWMAANAEQAIELGELLVRHGRRIQREARQGRVPPIRRTESNG
jgi:hypothetical protein